jgi:hypothetical protein
MFIQLTLAAILKGVITYLLIRFVKQLSERLFDQNGHIMLL